MRNIHCVPFMIELVLNISDEGTRVLHQTGNGPTV